MLLPRVFAPVRAVIQSSSTNYTPSTRVLDALRAANTTIYTSIRHATHQAQGRANGAKDGPGKRLGAKKSGGEYVIPGNIIFRQRGTAWYPGENCKMGRDHCIYSVASGYVRYYRDPLKHPDRQYIGVVFDKDDRLPYPVNAARKRRLNMLPVKREVGEVETVVEGDVVVESETSKSELEMGRGYAFRRTNYEIGKAGDEMKERVRKFVPGDRFTAWRKANLRKAANAERKKLRTAQKASKPKKRSR